MPDIALIGGTVFLESPLFADVKPRQFSNEFGIATCFVKDDLAFLPRHGVNRDIPPHRINYQANMKALKDAGVKAVVGTNSVGSLALDITPGSLIVPDDYINLWDGGTFYNDSLVHITPGLDEEVRKQLIQAAKNLSIPVLESGVYLQTRGPRLETRAEVRFLKNFADVVGMTMGSEATAAQEIDMRYAAIASVDNYAHGLVETVLAEHDIRANAHRSAGSITKIFHELVRNFRSLAKGGS